MPNRKPRLKTNGCYLLTLLHSAVAAAAATDDDDEEVDVERINACLSCSTTCMTYDNARRHHHYYYYSTYIYNARKFSNDTESE